MALSAAPNLSLKKIERASLTSQHTHKGVFVADSDCAQLLLDMGFKYHPFTGYYSCNIQSMFDRGRPQDEKQAAVWDRVMSQARVKIGEDKTIVGLRVGQRKPG